MRRHQNVGHTRPRMRIALCVASTCAVTSSLLGSIALLPATGMAATDVPLISVPAIDSIPDAPGDETTRAGSDVTGPTTPAPVTTAPPLGSNPQLARQRERLVARRDELQAALLASERAFNAASDAFDRAEDAVAARLVGLLDDGDDERIMALMSVRDAVDDAARADAREGLHPDDRQLEDALDAARVQRDAHHVHADDLRAQVRSVSTSIAAIDAVLAGRSDRMRELAGRYSIDSDHVFTTGAIPDIGYWGDLAGNSMLRGWMGYAGAALGGVGCTPPDASLHATGTIETGEASWYGPGFDGQATASGEVYDQDQMTAAHRTLPLGTIVRVTSATTGRCAFVRINDRGPFVDGRIIDLSGAAARQVAMDGVAPVQVEVWAADAPAAEPAP